MDTLLHAIPVHRLFVALGALRGGRRHQEHHDDNHQYHRSRSDRCEAWGQLRGHGGGGSRPGGDGGGTHEGTAGRRRHRGIPESTLHITMLPFSCVWRPSGFEVMMVSSGNRQSKKQPSPPSPALKTRQKPRVTLPSGYCFQSKGCRSSVSYLVITWFCR